MTELEVMKDKNLLIMYFQTKNEKWGLINIYASNGRVGRKETCDKLERIMEMIETNQIMCMGDFKTCLFNSKKDGRK